MQELIEKLHGIGLVPVIVLERAEDACPLAEALLKGGLPCAEITFRTEAAEEAISIMTKTHPELLVGAGTVLDCIQADKAMSAGASFIVTPGYSERITAHCLASGYPVIPGCATPADLMSATEQGLDCVKFFPAEAAGGLNYLRAIAAPFRNMSFLPTGGIHPGLLKSYLSWNRITACGGSWMTDPGLIRAGRFDEITRLCAEARVLVKEARNP